MKTHLTSFPACTANTSLLQATLETAKARFGELLIDKFDFYALRRGFLRENLGAINEKQPQISLSNHRVPAPLS